MEGVANDPAQTGYATAADLDQLIEGMLRGNERALEELYDAVTTRTGVLALLRGEYPAPGTPPVSAV